MTDDMPILENEITQELLDETEITELDLDKIKIPFLIKNKVLMSPGVWNNYYYSPEAIQQAFNKTDWNNKENRALFLDHEDRRSREWIGEVINPKVEGDTVYGDLVLIDKPTAQKLAYGAKMGISPKVHGEEEGNKMHSFVFDNFSVVINPAVKTAYINNVEEINEADGIMTTIEELSGSVSEVAKKAKEIRKPGESWIDAIKRAAKEIKAVPQEAKENMERRDKMSEDIADQLMQLAELLKKKKEEYPYPQVAAEVPKVEEPKVDEKKYPAPPCAECEALKAKLKEAEEALKQKCMEEAAIKKEELSAEATQIKELSEKLLVIEAKLNEPAEKQTVKAELSAMDQEQAIASDLDGNFMKALRQIGGM